MNDSARVAYNRGYNSDRESLDADRHGNGLAAVSAQAKADALEEAAGYVNRECFYSLTRPEVAAMLASRAAEYRTHNTN